jgi:septum formation protein
MKLILASQSPRRKQLLEWAEIEFEIIVADTDECIPEGVSFDKAAEHIALEKARVVAEKHPGRPVLAADTIVVCNGNVLGKPSNQAVALEMLTELSGNHHSVITGVALVYGNKTITFSDTTKVVFNELSEEQLIYYTDKYKPYDKAGAYAIQEWIGVIGIKNVQGDFYNVMGLPVNRVYALLKAEGLL